ncbi:Peptidase propeptide and YPEB domain-containing protein [Halopseudomonas xinjiangensis]|uniref:Peptidase propeptide and YPEB domain-containing protein n=1 Tax=Halopseudomonas xinjiangensis TaxID=487184 RepID=A0A1H1SGZ5_9GAMM|nr:PepSY domain-containing protein [Halopseudomonas xinjiangensis]SDS47201.1 Peptidase propeptide and YPEB domain-containing protein [Halopseudomonas xinjiangensis]
MKKLLPLLFPLLLAVSATTVQADDDVRLDEANRLMQEGKIQSFDSLNEKALKARAGEITDSELEQEHGRYVYKVEVRYAQGADWDLELDASNGEILQNRQDD